MKRLIEDTDATGLESLLGERVQVWCLNYIYTGKLTGVNTHDIELTDAAVIYETGKLTGKPTNVEAFPAGPWFVRMGAIESYGPAVVK